MNMVTRSELEHLLARVQTAEALHRSNEKKLTELEGMTGNWKTTLHYLDELLCEIISGNQGSFKPAYGTVSMANHALDVLRKTYPVKQQLKDAGITDGD